MKKIRVIALSAFIAASGCNTPVDNSKPDTSDKTQHNIIQDTPDCCCQSDFESAASHSFQPQPENTLYNIKTKAGNISLNGLIDHTGQEWDTKKINETIKGKTIAIYFGFPECTIFCPPSTKALTQAIQSTDANIVPLFISSKTGRTPQQMNDWLESFDGNTINAIGLTGPDEILGTIYNTLSVNDSHGTHVPIVYVINKQGEHAGSAITVKKDNNTLIPAPNNISQAIEMALKTNVQTLLSNQP